MLELTFLRILVANEILNLLDVVIFWYCSVYPVYV